MSDRRGEARHLADEDAAGTAAATGEAEEVSPNDRLLLAAMEREIREMGGRPLQLTIDWGVAWAVLGAIQLACRHPEFQGQARKVVEGFARYLQENITPGPACREIAEKGWELPSCDFRFANGAKEEGGA
jgi:hypothetical protein